MNIFKSVRKLAFGLLSGVAVLGLALASAAPALAAESTPEPSGVRDGRRLALAYKNLQRLAEMQGNHLARVSTEGVAKVQELIDRAKADGKDVSALEAALATFKASLADAQAAHDEAVNILRTHAGFDDNGQVTDKEQAKETVKSAAEALKEARQILREAEKTLRQAIREWRAANQPTPQPTATP
ncbi:MAG: hypothetical protein JNL09_02300 [Anaerolineales bacterium]|nr:hypothetical protein [Anaerolineales bacterium]